MIIDPRHPAFEYVEEEHGLAYLTIRPGHGQCVQTVTFPQDEEWHHQIVVDCDEAGPFGCEFLTFEPSDVVMDELFERFPEFRRPPLISASAEAAQDS